MNFFFIASLLVAVASASEADQAHEATANLRGVANNADEDNLEAFEAVMMSVDEANRACPAYKGCTAYDYCRSSGCGPCKNDSCTQPGGRGGGRGSGGRGGGRGRGGGWCQHLKGCKWHDSCRDSGCGRCDKKRNQCTKPRDEDEEEFNQDVVDTTTE